VNRLTSRSFLRLMHHLALLAMVLMLCMPVLSRWQQTHETPGESEMCLSGASRTALGMDAHAHHHPTDESPAAPHDHHDHDTCGYCTLATRMLPVLALVLALPPPPPARHSPHTHLPVPPAAPVWPAHSPRGPPLHA